MLPAVLQLGRSSQGALLPALGRALQRGFSAAAASADDEKFTVEVRGHRCRSDLGMGAGKKQQHSTH